MKGGQSALAALVAALILAQPALAADSAVRVVAELPVTVEGSHAAHAADGTFILEGDSGSASFLLQAQDGELERIIHRAFGYIKYDEPQLGVLWEQRVETETLPMADVFVSLQQRHEDFRLLITDADVTMTPGASKAPLHLGALGETRTISSEAPPPLEIVVGERDARPFEHTLRAGLFESRAMDGRVVATGAMEIYVADAVLHYVGEETETIRAHFREETHPGQIYDPTTGTWMGGGSHTEYVHEYVLLRPEAAKLQAQYLATPAILYDDRPSFDVVGSAHFPAATGTVIVHDGEEHVVHSLRGEDLDVSGAFSFDMAPAQRDHAAVRGDGDLTQVSYAAEHHEYDWAPVAVGIGAAILAALAWFTGAAKWVLGAIGGLFTGYARVQGEEILEHPGRLEVYERVKADPGMHFMDLCDRVPFGASTLNYHLRVLERNGYVTRVKDGRYVRFFDQKAGHYSRDRKHAASTLRNETTAAIAAHIIQNPGIAQRDLAQEFGIAASTVSWHIARLQKEGLVDKQRDQHFTRYYMGQAWSDLPSRELARVGLVA